MSEIVDPQATIDTPRAIRVKTSTGWADLVIQGPPGPGVAPGGAAGQALLKASGANYDTAWGTAGADLIYNGDFPANTPYTDGDIVVGSDGVVYMCVTPTSAAPTPWPGGPTLAPTAKPPYGTSLPASPIDGQEAVLTDSVTAPNYVWRFRYNAGSAASGKWEFVGGSAFCAQDATRRTTTLTAWTGFSVALTPNIVIPRLGNYEVSFGANMWTTGATATAWLALYASTSLPMPGSETWYCGNLGSGVARTVLVNVPAGNTLTFVARTDSGYTASYERMWMTVRPVNVV